MVLGHRFERYSLAGRKRRLYQRTERFVPKGCVIALGETEQFTTGLGMLGQPIDRLRPDAHVQAFVSRGRKKDRESFRAGVLAEGADGLEPKPWILLHEKRSE